MKNRHPHPFIQHRAPWIAALSIAALSAGASATPLTWNYASSGIWNDSSHWSPAQVPVNGDTVTFNSTGSGTTTTMDLNGLSLAGLTLSAPTVTLPAAPTPIAHTIDLGTNTLNLSGAANIVAPIAVNFNASGSLTITGTTGVLQADLSSLSIAVNSQISGGTGTNNTTGSLDLSGLTGGYLNVSGATKVGVGTGSSGSLSLGSGMDVLLGVNTSTRGTLDVASGYNAKTSSFLMDSGTFNAYLSSINIGYETRTNASTNVTGTVDLKNATGGTLDVMGQVLIGHGRGAVGKLLLGDNISTQIGSSSTRNNLYIGAAHTTYTSLATSELTAGANTFNAYVSNLVVGQGFSDAKLDLSDATGVLDVSGNVDIALSTDNNGAPGTIGKVILGDGMDMVIGSSSSRVALTILTGNSPNEGSLTAGTGTFTAYLTNMTIGRNTRSNASLSTVPGTLDLSQISNGVLDVSGDVSIGYNLGVNYGRIKGLVKLHETQATTQNLYIGDTTVQTQGTLELDNSIFAVSGTASLKGTAGYTGQVISTLNGESSGLDLGASATLTVSAQGLIDITFNSIGPGPTIYWGLRWAGSHTSDLQTLQTQGRLQWDDSALIAQSLPGASIFEDGGYTYVGVQFIPSPASGVLLLAGLGTIVTRRRNRS